MEKPILTNENQFPTDEVIFSIIGKTNSLWMTFFEFLKEQYPDFNPEWRYYKDGHSWLMKVVRKKKTVFWLSVIKDAFRITFYFSDKAEEDILSSGITNELKEHFKHGKHYGKIRGLTIVINDGKDIEYVKELIPIRMRY